MKEEPMQEFVDYFLPILALAAVPLVAAYPLIIRAIGILRMRRYYCPTCFTVVIAKDAPTCPECDDVVPTEMLPADRKCLAYYDEMRRIVLGTVPGTADDGAERHGSTLQVETGHGMQVCPKCFRIEYDERLRNCPNCSFTQMEWADPDNLEHYRRMQRQLGMS